MGWSIFENEHAALGLQMFADQFEPDGSGFIYRRSMKGSPVKVSQTERDQFVDAYKKSQRYSRRIFVAAAIVLVGIAVIYSDSLDAKYSEWIIWIGLMPVLVVFLITHRWAWNAPARELRGRIPLGQERSRAEVRHLMLARITYGQLTTGVGLVAITLFRLSAKTDLFSGWNRLWLAFAAVAILAAMVQAYRKWRFESSKGQS